MVTLTTYRIAYTVSVYKCTLCIFPDIDMNVGDCVCISVHPRLCYVKSNKYNVHVHVLILHDIVCHFYHGILNDNIDLLITIYYACMSTVELSLADTLYLPLTATSLTYAYTQCFLIEENIKRYS